MGLSVPPEAPTSAERPATLELAGVKALADALGKTVSVFDLETTGLNWAGASFGIVEVAVVHVHPDGTVETESSLVNPENPCQWGARKKHGISSAETSEAEPWGAHWAMRMHDIATTHVTVGFNSALFDCPAAMAQNFRYRDLQTQFAQHLDVRWLPGVRGRLEQVATHFGVEMVPNHRALADTLVLAELLDRIILQSSLEEVASRIEAVSDDGEAVAAGKAAQRAAEQKEARGEDLEELAALNGDDAVQRYIDLKAQEKQVKEELNALKSAVCDFVREQGGKVSFENCSISHQSRPKYAFTDVVSELKAQLDARKKQEIAEGLATEDGASEYVTLRWR